MKINNENEKQKFLELNIKSIGSYALVTYNNQTEAIWITRYQDHCEDGSDWFLESPCGLMRYEFEDSSDKEIREFVEEQYKEEYIEEGIKYVKSMIRDGWLYEIYNPQTGPFLPDVLDDLTLISEEYCLEWMLENRENSI